MAQTVVAWGDRIGSQSARQIHWASPGGSRLCQWPTGAAGGGDSRDSGVLSVV